MADLLFHMGGQVLPSDHRRDFGGFYRLYCRWDPASRVRASALREAYLRYALALGLGGLTFKELRLAMALRGHSHFYSNGSVYRGLRLLNVPEVPADQLENVSPPPEPPLATDVILAQLDRAMSEMRMLKRMLRSAVAQDRDTLPETDGDGEAE